MTFTCSRLIQSLRRDWRQHNRYKIQSFEASDCITLISSCRICHLVFLNRQGYREALCTFRTIENTDLLRKIQPFSSLNGWVIIQISVVISGRSFFLNRFEELVCVCVCVSSWQTQSHSHSLHLYCPLIWFKDTQQLDFSGRFTLCHFGWERAAGSLPQSPVCPHRNYKVVRGQVRQTFISI